MSVSACSLPPPPLSLNPTKTGIINVHWSKGNGRQRKWSPKERREKWSNGMKQQQKQLCSSCRTFLRLRRLLRSTLLLGCSECFSCRSLSSRCSHTHTQTIGSCLATECRLQQRQRKERDRNSKQWVKWDSLSLCSVCTFSSMEIQKIILNPLY